MSYKAIYAYPWDVAEIGVSAAVDRFLALGLDTVTITGSYHAGKFLRPHGKGGKVYFPEDGTVYFKPDLSRYGAIKPAQNSMLSSGRDIIFFTPGVRWKLWVHSRVSFYAALGGGIASFGSSVSTDTSTTGMTPTPFIRSSRNTSPRLIAAILPVI